MIKMLNVTDSKWKHLAKEKALHQNNKNGDDKAYRKTKMKQNKSTAVSRKKGLNK